MTTDWQAAAGELDANGYTRTPELRPVRTVRGWSAGPVRHGVSTVRSGRRHALGVVFRDA
jgi:uncharacterized protein